MPGRFRVKKVWLVKYTWLLKYSIRKMVVMVQPWLWIRIKSFYSTIWLVVRVRFRMLSPELSATTLPPTVGTPCTLQGVKWSQDWLYPTVQDAMDSDEQRVSNGSMDGSIRGMYLGGMYLNSSHWSHPKIPSTRHPVLVKSGSTKDINTQNYSRGNIRSIVYL